MATHVEFIQSIHPNPLKSFHDGNQPTDGDEFLRIDFPALQEHDEEEKEYEDDDNAQEVYTGPVHILRCNILLLLMYAEGEHLVLTPLLPISIFVVLITPSALPMT